MQRAGQQSVQSIAETGNHEHDQSPEVTPFHQVNDDERNKDHAQQGELVGGRENLGEPHARSLGAHDAVPGNSWDALDRASAADGSSPVLARKRCESEGRFPSGRSSSTRSMRCMGKKTTAGVNGSPSFTITARSSNEASSAPLKLRPSGASPCTIPQNFSRGVLRVTITIAPGVKGPCALACPPLPVLVGFFSTQRLSPGGARIATPRTIERLSCYRVESAEQ